MAGNDFEAWAKSVRTTLEELASHDFRYPLGVNEVRGKSRAHRSVPPALEPLYASFDGVSLPDVHVGYFIDPAHRVASAAERGEPTLVDGEPPRAVHVFGSDGGGGRFALGSEDGAVYYLPSSGAVRGGMFLPDDASPVRRVATSVRQFLDLLKADIEAFVHGEDAHSYMAR